jgi:cyclophilin family peptidyl-prolyl cis-trans isomerase
VLAEKGSAADTAIEVLTHDVAALTRPAVMIALEEHAFVAPRWTPLFAKLEVLFAVGGQARMSCLAALAHDRALARIERIDHCAGLDDVTRARYVARALSEADPKRVPVEALLALETNDRDARGSILEGLARYDDAKSADAIVAAAADGDLAVRSSAADAAAARKLAAAGPPLLAGVAAIAQHATTLSPEEAGTLPSLLAALTVLRPAGGADVLRAFLDGTPGAVALGARDAMKAYGKPSLIHPTPPVGRYDGDALADHVVVRLDTDRGMIRMALDAAHAPRNARNFAGLVRAHFYDGLTFHRIVPGFVAQGGDPRGDGTGGADSLVACEPNDLPYREGTVGMALSGPDTGSSQFFITLAPAPRLEGRYTAFARVIEGMDAARALEPGDHIRTARVE